MDYRDLVKMPCGCWIDCTKRHVCPCSRHRNDEKTLQEMIDSIKDLPPDDGGS